MNLEEIRARSAAASEGPWEADGWEVYGPARRWVAETHDPDNVEQCEADAEFVAHARTDIPNLLALVDALTAENARLRNQDGLARDALRRSGYLDVETSDRPLAELIEKLNTDARDAVRTVGVVAAQLRGQLNTTRRLCQSYTPEPPPLFRNPTSQHGEGYNHGTRDMAEAILGVLDGEEESS
jgi:hypothetical protein